MRVMNTSPRRFKKQLIHIGLVIGIMMVLASVSMAIPLCYTLASGLRCSASNDEPATCDPTNGCVEVTISPKTEKLCVSAGGEDCGQKLCEYHLVGVTKRLRSWTVGTCPPTCCCVWPYDDLFVGTGENCRQDTLAGDSCGNCPE